MTVFASATTNLATAQSLDYGCDYLHVNKDLGVGTHIFRLAADADIDDVRYNSAPNGEVIQVQKAVVTANLNYTITEDTKLEFEFRTTNRSDYHGVHFGGESRKKMQLAGESVSKNRYKKLGEWKKYRLRPPKFGLKGFKKFIGFEAQGYGSYSLFQNFRIYEKGQCDPDKLVQSRDVCETYDVVSELGVRWSRHKIFA